MLKPGLIKRLSRSARENPVSRRSKVIFASAAIGIVVGLLLFESRFGWPDWLTVTPVERFPVDIVR